MVDGIEPSGLTHEDFDGHLEHPPESMTPEERLMLLEELRWLQAEARASREADAASMTSTH